MGKKKCGGKGKASSKTLSKTLSKRTRDEDTAAPTAVSDVLRLLKARYVCAVCDTSIEVYANRLNTCTNCGFPVLLKKAPDDMPVVYTTQ